MASVPPRNGPTADPIISIAGVPVSAVGMIDDSALAERVVAEGDADAVMSGREWLRDPHFALRAAHELGIELDYWPAQYQRARWAS